MRGKFKFIIILLILLVGCSAGHPKADMSVYDGFPEEHRFLEIDSSKLISNLEKKENGVYLLTFHGNKTSTSYVEVLQDLSQEREFDVYVLDVTDSKLTDEESKSLEELNNNASMNKGIKGVMPLVYVVNDGFVDIVAPVIDGASVSGRYLTADEKEQTKVDLAQLTSKRP